MCMYTVYIIKSESTNKYYVGFTSDIENRLRHHNSGATTSTKGKGPWKLVYQEKSIDKKSAWLRERQIKKFKGGNAFKKLVIGGFA